MAAPEPRAEVHFLTGVQWERRVMLLVALELLAIAAYFTPDALGPVTSLQGLVQVEAFELGEEGRGNGRVEGLSLKVAGLALADIRATLFVRERVLVTDDLVATLASGHLSARWRLHLGRPAAHEGRAELLDADMGQLLQALGVEDTRYRGRLNTVVEWATPTGRIDDLVAVGAVRVRDGWLGEMPSVRSWSSLLGSLGSNTPQDCVSASSRA